MGAHRQGGALPPVKFEVLSRKRNSISKVSLNGRDAAFPRRKTMNDCSTPTISFLYIIKRIVLLHSHFEGERGDAVRIPRFGIVKPMLSPDFTIYTDQRQKS